MVNLRGALFIVWAASLIVCNAWEAYYACNGPCGLWQDVVRKSPNKARGWVNLGQAFRDHGDLANALIAFQEAERVSFEDPDPKVRQVAALLTATNISDVLLRAGYIEEAHEILKQSWEANPGFPGFATNLAFYYLSRHEPEKAVAIASLGLNEASRYPWFGLGMLYLNRASAYRVLGRCPEMKADLKKVARTPDLNELAPYFDCPIQGEESHESRFAANPVW